MEGQGPAGRPGQEAYLSSDCSWALAKEFPAMPGKANRSVVKAL